MNVLTANPKPSIMYYLIYSSKAAPGLTEDDLHHIITASQRNNESNDLTGLLVFHNGSFIQMLEGDEDAVQETFDRIVEDERHTAVYKLFSGQTDSRHFPDWKMAMRVVDENEFNHISAYEPLEAGDRFLHQVEDDHIGVRMLRYFYEMRGER